MFKNKPVILTTGPSVFSAEIKSLVEKFFGGIPIYANNDNDIDLVFLASHADALILSGGTDIFRGTLGEPILRGENLTKFDILRDKRELKLLNYFKEQGKPVLAICRGFQLICANAGFRLIPDLWGNICHSPGEIKVNLENGEFCHYVECLPDFQGTYFEFEPVNSYHHQAILIGKHEENIKEKGGLQVVGFADISTNEKENYKIAEIIEDEKHKIVGSQFHVEADWMYGNKASLAVLNRFKEFMDI